MVSITYKGLFGTYTRVFASKKDCILWLRQIGKPELIYNIAKTTEVEIKHDSQKPFFYIAQ